MIQALLLTVAIGMQASGQPLLDDLSRRAFDFFWNESHPTTGFTKDRAKNLGTSDTYTVASVASTGFALAALAIGVERGYVPREDALARARLTLTSLQTKTTRVRGWFYHFIDWKTGARAWNCEVSSIDSSILFAGMMLCERYFGDATVTQKTNQILAAVDWKWMLTDNGAKPKSLTFCMGYTPESGFINSRWSSYDENLMLYIQGLGLSKDLNERNFNSLARPVVTYKGIQTLTGGPLFIHHMSHVFLDFKNKRDTEGWDYWVATRNATLMQRQYAIDNPKRFTGYGADIWCLTANDCPINGYEAHGVLGFGADDGTLGPLGAVASLFVTPAESQAAADRYRANYPGLWGRYGFSVAINPSRNWVSQDVIGIDLGMMLLGIENARDGMPWKYSMMHPVNVNGFKRAGLRVTKEGPAESRKLRLLARG